MRNISVSDYAKKWEEIMLKQRDMLNDALNQVNQFRNQLLQEEQISQKMTRTKNLKYN